MLESRSSVYDLIFIFNYTPNSGYLPINMMAACSVWITLYDAFKTFNYQKNDKNLYSNKQEV